MGSPDEEPGRESNESPQRAGTISRGFWLGKYEITLYGKRPEFDVKMDMVTTNYSGVAPETTKQTSAG